MLSTTMLVAVGAGAQTTDWTTGPGGNAARDCLSAAVGPNKPVVLWQGSEPAIIPEQVVIEGDVAVVTRTANFDVETGSTIVAHDLNTGDILWTRQLPFVTAEEWRSRVSGIRDGRVYATRAGNTELAPLFALDVQDGSTIWQSEDLIDESGTEGVAYAPNGDIIVGNFNSIIRIDKDTGETVWSEPRSCPTSNGCLVSVNAENNHAYYWQASPGGPVVTALDITTGEALYSSEPVTGPGFIVQVGLFVGPDGTIYANRGQDAPGIDIFAALTDTGDALVEQWTAPTGFTPFSTSGVGPDGSVYTYLTDADLGDVQVVRRDPDDGTQINISDPISASDVAPSPRMVIDADGKVFVTTDEGLFAFNADLTLMWSVTDFAGVRGAALGQDGILVVPGEGNDVRAFQTAAAPCPADISGDGQVGVSDLLTLLGDWGACPAEGACAADLNDDDIVGVGDLLILLSEWGPCP